MPLQVSIDYAKKFRSSKPPAATFDYCADYEQAIPANFPGLEKFESLGNSKYRWLFRKLEYGGTKIVIDLITKLTDERPKMILIEQVPSKTPGEFSGSWTFTPKGKETEIEFSIRMSTELPVPAFLSAIATPLAQREMTRLFDTYLSNVEKALSK